MKVKKISTRLISTFFTFVLLIFAYKYISNLIDQADFSNVTIAWRLLAISVACFVFFYILLSIHWALSCRVASNNHEFNQPLAFLASQPYKYLPTSLFTFSFRAFYASKLGLGFRKSTVAQIVENTSMLLSNITLFGIFFLATFEPLYAFLLVLLILLVFMIAARSKARHTLKLRNITITVSVRTVLRLFILSSFAWLFAGLSFVVLNKALQLDFDIIRLIAANTIAFSLSILAFFAPGGIGVRELIFDIFSVNPLAIIIWRVLTFALDFFLGTMAIAAIELKRKKLVS